MIVNIKIIENKKNRSRNLSIERKTMGKWQMKMKSFPSSLKIIFLGEKSSQRWRGYGNRDTVVFSTCACRDVGDVQK